MIFEMGIKNNILECVGETPLVRLNSIGSELECELLVKCEFLNPGGSVKDRPAIEMMKNVPGLDKMTLIEPSSGNIGIALALVAAVNKVPIHVTMPDKMSSEKVYKDRFSYFLDCRVKCTWSNCSHDSGGSWL
jgi:cysteine synthase